MGNSKDNENTLKVDPELYDIINNAVEVGVSRGVKGAMLEYDRQQKNKKKIRYDRRLKNTQLLLENYKNFMDHCENAIYELTEDIKVTDEDDSVMAIFDKIYDMEEDKTIIESILKSKTRTIIILRHINNCINFYNYRADTSDNEELKRRNNVLNRLYINNKTNTYSEIAEELHISTKTVNRDRKAAIKELAPLFFGVDGIGLE